MDYKNENTVDNIGYILYTGIKDTKEGLVMPVISRFEGIVIKMYLRQKEHNPPHIHAIYGEYIGMCFPCQMVKCLKVIYQQRDKSW